MRSDVQGAGHVPSDEPVQRCVEGENWSQISSPGSSKYPHAARAVFDLPISSDTLYLLAQGSLTHGSATILDSQEGGENVKVEVVASFYTREALTRAKVCSLQRRSGENGVGIFTPESPKHRSKKDKIQFDIVVRIPIQRSHLVVNAFETELPMFTHIVGDIAETVEFRRLSLLGSSMPMTVTSLHAHHAKLVTSNSPITGSFNSSASLELRTSNAPINANVGLLNDPARKTATDLIMITSNGRIHSSISLTSSKTTNGLFNVKARTVNQPLELIYDTSPVDSIVHSEALTSNSPASVSHHSAFEGKIALKSTVFLPSVDKTDVSDPSGQGRHRSLEMLEAAGGVLTGVVYWGAERKEVTGFTQVVSTNSPVHLQV
ncbi:hypothetical protein PILCRDRAFT_824367 [Piloderma croceum F 1598]|uniref:Uncharacterized protein n=1 Tax=Piloderma croceum (strain F 1598) TaxID=765440 RepID=A0A0C3FEP2_PILCF|nr:hypothetical protein PILCRDRAFT_824367 [Piloderma croceum F 1598]